ncbi:DeoR family transcriptional regulator [Virgibacillus siamensis]|uniref:DeoR family transcriptional regulator n=1 Tax=Virgibacillus siamensis TaxID=480071 RepID=A0ABN1GFH5_9BACI
MNNANDWKKGRISAANRGENPMVMTELKSGFAVIGDTQFLPGYCLLLPFKNFSSLNELDYRQRAEYLLDMTLIGDAIQEVCSPKRINYSIYGNSDAFLHAHIFPRYEWEPKERRSMPVWQYPKSKWTESKYHYTDEKHFELKNNIGETLITLSKSAY